MGAVILPGYFPLLPIIGGGGLWLYGFTHSDRLNKRLQTPKK
jgi:hypothetical protein